MDQANLMIVNLAIVLTLSVLGIHLLQERFLSAASHKRHPKDYRYYGIRAFVILIILTALATNLEPVTVGIILHNLTLTFLAGFLVKSFQ